MTFSCGNHDIETDRCTKLKSRCIMGRRGCVLEGKVKLSEEILALLQKNDTETPLPTRRRNKK